MTNRTLCIAFAALLGLTSSALATPITITSTALPSMALNPSSDAISLDASSVVTADPGTIFFQTGTISIGDSAIVDQVIPFFLSDTITLNGMTKTINIYGQDDVTSSADLISIFAGTPVDFGSYLFSLNGSSYSGTAIGQILPLQLSADVAPTPEPSTLVLLGTGLVGGIAALTTRRPAAVV